MGLTDISHTAGSTSVDNSEPIFFASPAELRKWLTQNHKTATEVFVGAWRKGTGRPSVTWPEIVDEALCVGWIDGVRRKLDDERWVIRLTPRTARSNWSEVNVRRFAELAAAGRVKPAGRAAFERRDAEKTQQYSYEARSRGLDAAAERALEANSKAWTFWSAQPPGYRRTASWWVMSAKKPETRLRRLATLIDDSAHARRIAPLRRN